MLLSTADSSVVKVSTAGLELHCTKGVTKECCMRCWKQLAAECCLLSGSERGCEARNDKDGQTCTRQGQWRSSWQLGVWVGVSSDSSLVSSGGEVGLRSGPMGAAQGEHEARARRLPDRQTNSSNLCEGMKINRRRKESEKEDVLVSRADGAELRKSRSRKADRGKESAFVLTSQ